MTATAENIDEITGTAEKIGFKDEEEFIRTAIDTLLAARPDLRRDIAVELYREGKISLGKAVEISGIGRRKFKQALKEKDIERKTRDIESSVEDAENYLKG